MTIPLRIKIRRRPSPLTISLPGSVSTTNLWQFGLTTGWELPRFSMDLWTNPWASGRTHAFSNRLAIITPHAASRESRRAVPRSADKEQRSRRRPRHCVGRREQGLEFVRREVTYDNNRHNDAVTGEW